MDRDAALLAMILQHVRELAEIHTGLGEDERYKLVTPFPPDFNDFPDFQKEQLDFRDPQTESVAAQSDTIEAFDFYTGTDYLYYDYSYGIKLEEPTLTRVSEVFFANAIFDDSGDPTLQASFVEKKTAFERKDPRFFRQTVPDQSPYIFTSYSPLRWEPEKVVLASAEAQRLREKTLSVYQSLEVGGDYLAALIAQISAASYAEIKYEFGFFDVIRQWVDPSLFDSPHWRFNSPAQVLYGASDPLFESGDVHLCYARRFYVIKNYSGRPATPAASDPVPPPVVRDHRRIMATRRRALATLFVGRGRSETAAEVRDHRRGGPADPPPESRDHRRAIVRDKLLERKITQLQALRLSDTRLTREATGEAARPAPRAGYVWVEATATVPGHWERERAGGQTDTASTDEKNDDNVYKVAAVLCRRIPRKPAAQPA